MKLKTSKKEIKDLSKAWFAISLAFTIVLDGLKQNFIQTFIISAIAVGLGFLLHELGHKFIAQRYNYFAEFRSFDQMLLLAVLMSFFGFIFAAPGAVMISGRVTKTNNGKISAAGPLVNIILGFLFLLISLKASGFLQQLTYYGVLINSWLALFNLIPVWNFDGKKILAWNKGVWILMGITSIILLMLTF